MPYIKECTTLSSRFHLFAFQKQTTFSRIISQWPDIGVGWKSLEWNLEICKYKTERTHIKDLQNRWGPWSLRHDPWQPSWPMTPWQPSWLAISLIPRPTPWLTPRLKLFCTLAMIFFSINTHSTLRFTLLWFWGNLLWFKFQNMFPSGGHSIKELMCTSGVSDQLIEWICPKPLFHISSPRLFTSLQICSSFGHIW